MDGKRFDDLARKLAGMSSRRGLLRAIAGGAAVLAMRIPGLQSEDNGVEAATCTAAGKACSADGNCCAGLICVDKVCRKGCRIRRSVFATGVVNPNKPCQTCRPELSTTAWSPAAEPQPCDDGNLCTVADYCDNGTCHAGTKIECVPRPCQTAKCDPKTGQCVYRNRGNGSACSAPPIDACHTAKGVCEEGVCVQNEKTCGQCSDGCDPETGCIPKPDETPCDNGKFCDGPDHCIDGHCVSTGEGVAIICPVPRDPAKLVCWQDLNCHCDERTNKVVPNYKPKGATCTPPSVTGDAQCYVGTCNGGDRCKAKAVPNGTACTPTDLDDDPACYTNHRCEGGRCVSDYHPCGANVQHGICESLACDGQGGCIASVIPFNQLCSYLCPGSHSGRCSGAVRCNPNYSYPECVDRSTPADTNGCHRVLSGNECTVRDGTCVKKGICNVGICEAESHNGGGCSQDSQCCEDQLCLWTVHTDLGGSLYEKRCHTCESREGEACVPDPGKIDDTCCPSQECVCGSSQFPCQTGTGFVCRTKRRD